MYGKACSSCLRLILTRCSETHLQPGASLPILRVLAIVERHSTSLRSSVNVCRFIQDSEGRLVAEHCTAALAVCRLLPRQVAHSAAAPDCRLLRVVSKSPSALASSLRKRTLELQISGSSPTRKSMQRLRLQNSRYSSTFELSRDCHRSA